MNEKDKVIKTLAECYDKYTTERNNEVCTRKLVAKRSIICKLHTVTSKE